MSATPPGRPPYYTQNYSFPVPGGQGLAYIPAALQPLADLIDQTIEQQIAASWPQNVANLPTTNLQNNQEVYLQTAAMMATGAVWHLKYRSAASSAGRWEFLGGGPIEQTVQSSGDALAQGLNPVLGGPQVTLPRPGDYSISFGAVFIGQPGSAVSVGIDGGGLSADAQPMIEFQTPGAQLWLDPGDGSAAPAPGFTDTASLTIRRTVSSESATLTMSADCTGSAALGDRFISATPIRLG